MNLEPMKPVIAVAAIVFTLVAVVHVHRLLFGWEVIVDDMVMPLWTSVAGAVIAGVLAVFLWRECRYRQS